MKKIMAVLSDESYKILREYKKEMGAANLDTALDAIIKENELKKGVKEDV